MINLVSKTRTRITRNIEVKISGDELRELVMEHFKSKRGIVEDNFIPPDASIIVSVPGGADYSNCDLDIDDDCPITISWTEEEGSDE